MVLSPSKERCLWSPCTDLPAFHYLQLELCPDRYPLPIMVRRIRYVLLLTISRAETQLKSTSTRHHPTRRLRQARGQLFRRKNHRLWHALLRAYHRAQRRHHNSNLCPLVVLFSPDTAHTRGRRGKDVYERGGYSDRERGAI